MVGGYSMIDCKCLDIGINETQTIPGLNKRLNEAVDGDKPILLCNLLFEDDHMTPAFAYVTRRALGVVWVFVGSVSFIVRSTDEVVFD